jgi:hypothetical protein
MNRSFSNIRASDLFIGGRVDPKGRIGTTAMIEQAGLEFFFKLGGGPSLQFQS